MQVKMLNKFRATLVNLRIDFEKETRDEKISKTVEEYVKNVLKKR